jgi:xanthine dehydrogenase FAD-binding subunit
MYDFKSYTEATSLEQALHLLANTPNASPIAGGTDMLIKLRHRDASLVGRDLVGISRILELRGVRQGPDGVTIGALQSFAQLEMDSFVRRSLPGIASAAASVGGPQIRHMGTIGGNICNGATSADLASILFAHNAVLLISRGDTQRSVPIADFYIGPGRVRLDHGEILTGLYIARADYEGFSGSYIKFATRQAMDIATLGCAVVVKQSSGVMEDLRIAFGVAGPTPCRAFLAEAYAKGKTADRETLRLVGEKCLESTRARESWRATALLRERLITVLPSRAIEQALNLSREAL